MKKILLTIIVLLSITSTTHAAWYDFLFKDAKTDAKPEQSIILGADFKSFQRSLIPIDSTENLGTSTSPWNELHVNQICLSADCKTAWPTGGGGGGTFAWTPTTNYAANANATTSAIWVQNNLFASSSIYAHTNITAGNLITGSYFIATSTTATSSIAGGFDVQGTSIAVDRVTGKVGIGKLPGTASYSLYTTNSLADSYTVTGGASFSPGTLYFGSGNTGVQTMYDWTFSTVRPVLTFNRVLEGTAYSMYAGVGTTAPAYAKFGVQPTIYDSPTINQFVVASSSNKVSFLINNLGDVGIGTTSPYAKFSVAGKAVVDDNVYSSFFTATSTATSTYAGGIDAARVCITGTAVCLGAAGGGSGTVTSVATNNGLTGGTITTTGTIGLDITKLNAGAISPVAWNGTQLVATGTPDFTAGYFTATTTTASKFPYASSTLITATNGGMEIDFDNGTIKHGGSSFINTANNLITDTAGITSLNAASHTVVDGGGNTAIDFTDQAALVFSGYGTDGLLKVTSGVVGVDTNTYLTGIAWGNITGTLANQTDLNNALNKKISTSTSETAGSLAYWTTTAGTPSTLGQIATTTVGCSGNISCTGFNALGSNSTISFTGTLPVANGGTGTTDRTLTQSDSSVSVDWQNLALKDGSGNSTVLWGTTILDDGSGNTKVNWGSGLLRRTNGSYSVDWQNSQLLTAINAPVLSWGNGNIGIGTTSPYAKLSVVGETVSAYYTATTTATSTFAGGVSVGGYLKTNLTAASCDVKALASDGTLYCGTDATTAGGGAFAWTPGDYAGQSINATSTGIRFLGSPLSLIASTTLINYASTTAITVSGAQYNSALTSAIVLTGADGLFAEYAGTSCTNQFVRSLSALGAATCATVANTDLANSTISGIALGSNLADLTATDSTLTFSGTYNGSTARSIGINLSNPNSWTGLQSFKNASSTLFSNTGIAYFGGTATSTFAANGALNVKNGITVDSGVNTGFTYSSGVTNIGSENFSIFDTDAANLFNFIGNTASETFQATFGPADIQLKVQDSNDTFSFTGGYVGIGTTTPKTALTIASTTGPQLSLSNGAGISRWIFRNAGGNLYFATTSIASDATTTISAFEIAGGGFGTTTLRGLNISGQATSTSNVGINISGGCFAINGVCISGGAAGSGETNTASSLGTGRNIFDTKSGVDLRFNTIAAGTNITLSTTTNSNTIVISSTGGSGGAVGGFAIVSTSTLITLDMSQYATSTTLKIDVGSSNITINPINATSSLGAWWDLDIVSPLTGVIGTTTISYCNWDGQINPGSNTVNGLTDTFRIKATASTTAAGVNSPYLQCKLTGTY